MATVRVYRDHAGEYRWNKRSGSRIVGAATEGFKDKSYAVKLAKEQLDEDDELVIEDDEPDLPSAA